MASRLGLIYRNEKAQARVDTALASIIANGAIDVAPLPAKTRDPKENETLQLEWLASALEAVEGSVRKPTRAKAAKDGEA